MTRRPTSSRGPLEVRIMGIDPGSVVTGIGVIDAGGGSVRHVHHATIKVGGDAFPLRLRSIFERVTGAIEEFRPDEVAVEQVFVSRNASSALKLGQARGAAICAALAMHCEIAEYSARSVKQAIVGRGGADKRQIQHMVGVLLGLARALEADAADALGIAICHAHHRETRERMAANLDRQR